MESPGSRRLNSRYGSSSSPRRRSPRKTRTRSRSPCRDRDSSRSSHMDWKSSHFSRKRRSRKDSRSPHSNRNPSHSPHRNRTSSVWGSEHSSDVTQYQNVMPKSLNIDEFGSMDSDSEDDNPFPVHQHVISSHDLYRSVIVESTDGVPISQSQIAGFEGFQSRSRSSDFTDGVPITQSQIAGFEGFQSRSRSSDFTERRSKETEAYSSAKSIFPSDPQIAMQRFIEALNDPESFKKQSKTSPQDEDMRVPSASFVRDRPFSTDYIDLASSLDKAPTKSRTSNFLCLDDPDDVSSLNVNWRTRASASNQTDGPRSSDDFQSRNISKVSSRSHSKGSKKEEKKFGRKVENNSVKLAWHSTPVDRRKAESESDKKRDTKSKNPLLNSLKQATKMGLGATKSKKPKQDEEDTSENMDLSPISSTPDAVLQNSLMQSIPQSLQELLQSAIKDLTENALRTIQQASMQSLSHLQPLDVGFQQTMQLLAMHGIPQDAVGNTQQQHIPNMPPPDFGFQHNMPLSGMQGVPQNAMGNMPCPDFGFQHNMPPPGMQGIPQNVMENRPPPDFGFQHNMPPSGTHGVPQNHLVNQPPPGMQIIPPNAAANMPPPGMQSVPQVFMENVPSLGRQSIPQNPVLNMPPPSMQGITQISLSNPPPKFVMPPPAKSQLSRSMSSSSPLGPPPGASKKLSRFDEPPSGGNRKPHNFNESITKSLHNTQTKRPIPVTVIYGEKPPTKTQTRAPRVAQKIPSLLDLPLLTAPKKPSLVQTPLAIDKKKLPVLVTQKTDKEELCAELRGKGGLTGSSQPVIEEKVSSQTAQDKEAPEGTQKGPTGTLVLKPLDTDQCRISLSSQEVKGTKNPTTSTVEVGKATNAQKVGRIFCRSGNVSAFDTSAKISKNRVPGDKDPLSDLHPSTPTRIVHLKSGINGCDTVMVRRSLECNLISHGIEHLNISVSQKNNNGNPDDYLTVYFESPNHAERWFKKTNRKITLQFVEGRKVTYYLYYAREPWRCKGCPRFLNVFYRSLCYRCYTHKNGAFPRVTFSDKPTRYLGITKLPLTVNENNVMSHFPENVFQTYHLRSVEIVDDPEMKCCSGLVIVETQDLSDAESIFMRSKRCSWQYPVKFLQYDDNHPESHPEMTHHGPTASAQMKPPILEKGAAIQKRPLLDEALRAARTLLDATQAKPLIAADSTPSPATPLAIATQNVVIKSTAQDVDGLMMKIAPDGKGSVKFPAPNTNLLVFDPDVGFRYDETTGLHYDANSGYFFNSKLKIFLYWDMFTQTYLPVDNPKIPFPIIRTQKDPAESKLNTESEFSGTVINMKELIERNRQIKLEQDKAHQNALTRSRRRSRSRSKGRDRNLSKERDQGRRGSKKRKASPAESDEPKKHRRSHSPRISPRRTSNSPEQPKRRDDRNRDKSPGRHGRHHPQRKSKSPLRRSKVRSRSPGPSSKKREEQQRRGPLTRSEKDNKAEGQSGRRKETQAVSENDQIPVPSKSKWELDETTEKDESNADKGSIPTSCSEKKSIVHESAEEKEELTNKKHKNWSGHSKHDHGIKDSSASRKHQDSSDSSSDMSRDKDKEKARSTRGNSSHGRQKRDDKCSRSWNDPSSERKTSIKENDKQSLDKKSDGRARISSNVGVKPDTQKENSPVNEERNHRLMSERHFVRIATRKSRFSPDETVKSDFRPESIFYSREEKEAENIPDPPLCVPHDLSDFVVLDGVESGEDSCDEMTEETLELLLADENEDERSEARQGEGQRLTSKGHPAVADHKEEEITLLSAGAVENAKLGTTNLGEKKLSGADPGDTKSIETSALDLLGTYSQPPSPNSSIFSSYDFSDDEKFVTISVVRESDEENETPENDCIEGAGDGSSKVMNIQEQKQVGDSATGPSNEAHSEFHSEDVSRVTTLSENINVNDAGKLMNEAGSESVENSDVNNAAELMDKEDELIGNDDVAKLMYKIGVDSASNNLCPVPSLTPAQELVDTAGDELPVNSNANGTSKLMDKARDGSIGNSETNCAPKLIDKTSCHSISKSLTHISVDGAVGISQTIGLEKQDPVVQKTNKEALCATLLENQGLAGPCQPFDEEKGVCQTVKDKEDPEGTVKGHTGTLVLTPLDTEQNRISSSSQELKGTKNPNTNTVEVVQDKKYSSKEPPDKKVGSIFSRLGSLKALDESAKISENRVPGDKDPLSDLYLSTPTCFVHLKSGINGCDRSTVKPSLESNLIKHNIEYSNIFVAQRNNNGNPYEYLAVHFKSPTQAELWFKKTNRKITLQFRVGQNVTYYMYYADKLWHCKSCSSVKNIFYKSLCHLCYTHKSGAFSSVKFSKKPTRYLGIVKLPHTVNERNVMSYIPNAVFKKYRLRSVEIVDDPEMKCCSGLVIVETQDLNDAKSIFRLSSRKLKFVQYDDNHPESPPELTDRGDLQNQDLDDVHERDDTSGRLSRRLDDEFDERRSHSSRDAQRKQPSLHERDEISGGLRCVGRRGRQNRDDEVPHQLVHIRQSHEDERDRRPRESSHDQGSPYRSSSPLYLSPSPGQYHDRSPSPGQYHDHSPSPGGYRSRSPSPQGYHSRSLSPQEYRDLRDSPRPGDARRDSPRRRDPSRDQSSPLREYEPARHRSRSRSRGRRSPFSFGGSLVSANRLGPPPRRTPSPRMPLLPTPPRIVLPAPLMSITTSYSPPPRSAVPTLPKPDGRDLRWYPPPDPSQFQFEPISGLLFDPLTGLYFDEKSGTFYNGDLNIYMGYDPRNNTYFRI